MRAVIVEALGAIDSPTVQVVPDPEPGKGEVVIENHAAGVNFPDAMVIEGPYQVRPPLPFSPGKELAGIVSAVGDEVEGIKTGDRVIAQIEYGAWAERVCVHASNCCHVPLEIEFAEAVSLGLTYQTAWFALKDRSQYREGETVLVTGAAGGVGLAAVELSHAFGANVIAGVRHASQHDLVRDHGAGFVADLGSDDLRKSLKNDVMAMTDGKGVDIALENVGGEVFDAVLRTLNFGGRLVVIGFAGGTIPEIKAGLVLVKNISITGLNWALYRELRLSRVRDAQKQIFELAVAGRLKPAIMARYPLDGFAEALTKLRAGSLQGQFVIEPLG